MSGRSGSPALIAVRFSVMPEPGKTKTMTPAGTSVKLSAPEIGVIYGNVAPAPGNDPARKVILWNPPT